MAEDLAAQVEHDLLAGPLHEVGLEEFEGVGERERAEVDGGELGDAGHGAAAEMAGEPGELLGRQAGHVGVDGDHDEVGAEDVGAGLDEDGDGGDAGLQLVGRQIGEQTAHQARVVGLADDLVVVGGGGGLLLLRLLRFVSGLLWFGALSGMRIGFPILDACGRLRIPIWWEAEGWGGGVKELMVRGFGDGQSLGVYISVPFCKAKCTFCNFASGAFALERLDGVRGPAVWGDSRGAGGCGGFGSAGARGAWTAFTLAGGRRAC